MFSVSSIRFKLKEEKKISKIDQQKHSGHFYSPLKDKLLAPLSPWQVPRATKSSFVLVKSSSLSRHDLNRLFLLSSWMKEHPSPQTEADHKTKISGSP